MSYVNIPPAYYAANRPGTLYHPGGRGWSKAQVPGWGENPAMSWPAAQAVNGLGAAPPCTPGPCPSPPSPAFSYVGTAPFNSYTRLGVSPWGRFPNGPGYAAPRPLACKSCWGMPITPGVGDTSCPPGQISSGGACLPCPPGSDLDECQPPKWYEGPLAGPIAIGVATALGTGLVLALLKKTTHVSVEA